MQTGTEHITECDDKYSKLLHLKAARIAFIVTNKFYLAPLCALVWDMMYIL